LEEKNLTARIQAGIIGQDLERELGKKGQIIDANVRLLN
jgi:FAD/FMN-containing dehydrogenase